MEFYCVTCSMYQCENCCQSSMSGWSRTSSSVWKVKKYGVAALCVLMLKRACLIAVGSSPRMLPFASWNLKFVEMVKVSKGKLQDRAAAAEAAAEQTNTTAKELPEEKYSATAAARIKMEKGAASTSDTTTALGNLSITGAASTDTPQASAAEPPKSQALGASEYHVNCRPDAW